MAGRATYKIHLAPRAERAFLSIEFRTRRRLARRIDALANDPRPRGVKKLKGEDDLYRLRVGDYRVIYQVQDRVLLVLVLDIGHRRNVYR